MTTLDARLKEELSQLIPDKRTTFCTVRAQGGSLEGLATPDFEPFFYQFAKTHKLASRVNFIEPSSQYLAVARCFLRAEPNEEAEVVSELIYGERVKVFDREDQFVRVAREKDNYLGWLAIAALSHHIPQASHQIAVPRAHAFTAAKVASAIKMELSLGAILQVIKEENNWSEVLLAKNQKAYVRSSLLKPFELMPSSSAKKISQLALRFIDAPYVWGGVTAWGLDCSGLVQTVYGHFGIVLERDADQQSKQGNTTAASEIELGDLLFFPGHVAIALSKTRFIHANAHHMRVTVDDSTKSSYAKNLLNQLQVVKRVL